VIGGLFCSGRLKKRLAQAQAANKVTFRNDPLLFSEKGIFERNSYTHLYVLSEVENYTIKTSLGRSPPSFLNLICIVLIKKGSYKNDEKRF